MEEFLDAGFKAMIVCVRVDKLSVDLLGRMFDREVIKALESAGIDPCGEYGEYHTLVLDGPIFKKRIEVLEGRVEHIPKGYAVFNIRRWRLADKKPKS